MGKTGANRKSTDAATAGMDVRLIGQQRVLLNVAGDVSQGLAVIDLGDALDLSVEGLEGGQARLQRRTADGGMSELGRFSSVTAANAAMAQIGDRLAHLPYTTESSFTGTPRRIVIGAVLASLALSVFSVVTSRDASPVAVPGSGTSDVAVTLQVPESLTSQLAATNSGGTTNLEVSVNLPAELSSALIAMAARPAPAAAPPVAAAEPEGVANQAAASSMKIQTLMALQTQHGPDAIVVERDDGELVVLPSDEERAAIAQKWSSLAGASPKVPDEMEAMVEAVASGRVLTDGQLDLEANIARREERLGIEEQLFGDRPQADAQGHADLAKMAEDADLIRPVGTAPLPEGRATALDRDNMPGARENDAIRRDLRDRMRELEDRRRELIAHREEQLREWVMIQRGEDPDVPKDAGSLDAFGLE